MSQWSSLATVGKSVLIWSEAAHRYYDESLYYHFIGLRRFRQEWTKDFAKNLERAIPGCGYCLYEIYGSYDVLLRIWLNPRTERAFTDLVTSDADILSLAAFQVNEGFSHWAAPGQTGTGAAAKQKLSSHGADEIRRAQADAAEGSCTDRIKRLLADRLVLSFVPVNSNEKVKFFMAIGPPPSAPRERERQIIEDISSTIYGHTGISQASMYLGRGGTWALLKGTVEKSQYEQIGRLVTELSAKLSPSGLRTLTYLATGIFSIEADYIADDSLKTPALQDREVVDWLRELENMDTALEPGELAEFVSYVRSRNLFRMLAAEDREFVRELLVCRIKGQSEHGRARLLLWVVDLENAFRDAFHPFVVSQARQSGKHPDEIIKNSKAEARVDAAKYTLGDSVKLYVAAIKKLELQNVELKGFFDNYAPRATEYRNNLVHGILRDPVGGQSWKGLLDFLAEFLPVNRRFVELIKGHGNVEKGATS